MIMTFNQQSVSPMLRPKEAAQWLGIGLSTFWLKVKTKELKTIKLGAKTTVIALSELQSFVERASHE